MKPPESTSGMNHRRDILRGCLRCGGLLAIGGVASALGWRSLHGNCQQTAPCGVCPLLSACDLPQARDARNLPAPVTPACASKPNRKHA